jgi:hypothetical protein
MMLHLRRFVVLNTIRRKLQDVIGEVALLFVHIWLENFATYETNVKVSTPLESYRLVNFNSLGIKKK